MFSKKATKFDKIFTVDLTLCSKCQIDGEDFVKFCGLLRKHELYKYIFDLAKHVMNSVTIFISTIWTRSLMDTKCLLNLRAQNHS